MSGPGTPDALLAVLDLVETAPDVFQAHCPPSGLQQVFGGQVVAQALAAARRTVDADAHSLHAYFLDRGEPGVPLELRVERLRDGRTFAARSVVVRQRGRALLTLQASFAPGQQAAVEHALPPTPVPGPEAFEDPHPAEAGVRALMSREFPDWDVRRVPGPRPAAGEVPVQQVWLRCRGTLPAVTGLQHSALAYLSDMTLLACSLRAWRGPGQPQIASIDHAVWFYGAPRVDEWLLYDQSSPVAGSGRSVNLGRLYDRDGVLVAAVAQEGLLRGAPPGG